MLAPPAPFGIPVQLGGGWYIGCGLCGVVTTGGAGCGMAKGATGCLSIKVIGGGGGGG